MGKCYGAGVARLQLSPVASVISHRADHAEQAPVCVGPGRISSETLENPAWGAIPMKSTTNIWCSPGPTGCSYQGFPFLCQRLDRCECPIALDYVRETVWLSARVGTL